MKPAVGFIAGCFRRQGSVATRASVARQKCTGVSRCCSVWYRSVVSCAEICKIRACTSLEEEESFENT